MILLHSYWHVAIPKEAKFVIRPKQSQIYSTKPKLKNVLKQINQLALSVLLG